MTQLVNDVTSRSDSDQFRKKFAYANGVRKVRLLAGRAVEIANSNLPEALEFGTEAVTLGRSLIQRVPEDDPRRKKYYYALAAALQALGLCRLRELRSHIAEPLFQESADLFEKIEEWDDMLSSLYSLADAANSSLQYEKALEHIDRSLEICIQLKGRQIDGMLYAKKGVTLLSMQRFDEAEDAIQLALERIKQYKTHDRAHLYSTAGYLYHTMAKYDKAIESTRLAIETIQPLEEHRYDLLVYKSNYARSLIALGRRADAIRETLDCLHLSQAGEFQQLTVWALKLLGQLHTERGELHDALLYFSQAIQSVNSSSGDSEIITLRAFLGQVYCMLGDSSSGLEILRNVSENLNNPAFDISSMQVLRNKSLIYEILVEHAPQFCDLAKLDEEFKSRQFSEITSKSSQQMVRDTVHGQILELLMQPDAAAKQYQIVQDSYSGTGAENIMALVFLARARLNSKIWNNDAAYAYIQQAAQFAEQDTVWSTQRKICILHIELCERLGKFEEAVKQQRHLRRLETGMTSRNPVDGMGHLVVETTKASLEQQCQDVSSRQVSLRQDLNKLKQTQQLLTAHNDLGLQALKRITGLLETHKVQSAGETQDLTVTVNNIIDNILGAEEINPDKSAAGMEDQRFQQKLQQQFPDLSGTERKVCNYIRRSVSNRQMSEYMNVSLRAIETYRYRIRHKIGLERGADLVAYIKSLPNSGDDIES